MRLTKFNPESGQYEYIEPAKTQAEFNEQRKAVIQRLGELEYQEAYYDWSLNEEKQEHIRKLIAGNIDEFQVNTAEEAELLETNVALFLDHLVDTLLEMDDHSDTVLYRKVVSAITLEFGAFCTALDEKFKEKNIADRSKARAKLISLLADAEGQTNNDLPPIEKIADYLLEHGIFVDERSGR